MTEARAPRPAAPPPEAEEPAAPPRAPVRRLRWTGAVLAAAYAAAIFWASSRPNPFPFLPSRLWSEDKLLHATAYALLGALLRLTFAGAARGRRPLVLAVAIAAAYGATDEVHQAFVPGRSADVRDWAADVGGALAGAALASAFLRRRVGAGSIRT